ncbi:MULTISPECIES: PadR family transcriptional regulator [Bifidobacterium]|uniref:Transcription regulator PadR N-terminal domain-containing protein n=2 Tax=Bifidobacterium TaxID=1678 RepID=A0A2M9HN32_9BIFI|nr:MULTISPECIES: PadR family transcriptional regulator [Bifidobacterium]NMM99354.1 PadR family transcriptional regulator [Bifidobacterium sp. DSM 109959]PJM78228.1 hypothetical protein CUU80_10515 [Bifidobacterium scaligerum]
MALKHAILSALSRGVPRTGYELSAAFRDVTDSAWHASPSQVYSELQKMAAAGLIAVHKRDDRGKTSYVITDDGMTELRRWLIDDEPDHSVRDDASLRMLTLWVLDKETIGYLIDAEVAFQQRRLIQLERLLKEWKHVRPDTPVWRNRYSSYVMNMSITTVRLSWLKGLRTVLLDENVDPEETFAYLTDVIDKLHA